MKILLDEKTKYVSFIEKKNRQFLKFSRNQNHPNECQKSGKIWATFEPSSEPFEFSSDRQDRSGFGSRPAATHCVHASAFALHSTRRRGRGDMLLANSDAGRTSSHELSCKPANNAPRPIIHVGSSYTSVYRIVHCDLCYSTCVASISDSSWQSRACTPLDHKRSMTSTRLVLA